MKKSQQSHKKSTKKSTKKITSEKLKDISGGNTDPFQVLRDRQHPSLREIIDRTHR